MARLAVGVPDSKIIAAFSSPDSKGEDPERLSPKIASKENSVQSWAQVRKIDGEKKIVALKSAAATLEFILQLEGDKQVLQASLFTAIASGEEEGRGMALLGYCSFQASPKALYIFRYAVKRCASF